jgi:hypothetical protein
MSDVGDLERLAELVRVKNAADQEIARLIGRPCQAGHVGEWIAAAVFDIALHESATTAASDGIFRSGALAGRTVNVKWYGLAESLLDVHRGEGPDTYLVMTGPRSGAPTSRGRTRPWVISQVYLFEHAVLVAELRGRAEDRHRDEHSPGAVGRRRDLPSTAVAVAGALRRAAGKPGAVRASDQLERVIRASGGIARLSVHVLGPATC